VFVRGILSLHRQVPVTSQPVCDVTASIGIKSVSAVSRFTWSVRWRCCPPCRRRRWLLECAWLTMYRRHCDRMFGRWVHLSISVGILCIDFHFPARSFSIHLSPRSNLLLAAFVTVLSSDTRPRRSRIHSFAAPPRNGFNGKLVTLKTTRDSPGDVMTIDKCKSITW